MLERQKAGLRVTAPPKRRIIDRRCVESRFVGLQNPNQAIGIAAIAFETFMEARERDASLLRETRITGALRHLGPYPREQGWLNGRRLEGTAVEHVVCERARQATGA